MASLFLAVEQIYAKIEIGGKDQPNKIREHEPTCGSVYAPKTNRGI